MDASSPDCSRQSRRITMSCRPGCSRSSTRCTAAPTCAWSSCSKSCAPAPTASRARAPRRVVPEGQPHPSTWRWLIRLLPPASSQAASAAAVELAQLLQEPGTAALFTTVPALRHHLRPLCRALGLALPGEPPPTPPEHDPPTPPPAPPITPLPFGAELVHGRAPAPAPKPAPILGPPRYRYRLVPFSPS